MDVTLILGLAIGAATLALLACVFALLVWRQQRLLQRRYLSLFGAEGQGTVSDVLTAYAARVEAVAAESGVTQDRLAELDRGLQHSLQCASVMRYNPFTDTGGDQSFVLVLADGQGDGAILNSLHARGLTRVYAKPLVRWTSPHQLSAEEQEALRKAQTEQPATGG